MKNQLKNKIKQGKATFGSWISLPCPTLTEIVAKCGFDWLVIDLEHSSIGINHVEEMIRAINIGECIPLVRLSSNDPVLAKKVMDIGAYGIIVPMVNTSEEARLAVSSVKYPPVGNRGVGLYRAQHFGKTFDDYKNTINQESVVIVQIEHKTAVENIDDILSVDGVDGCFIGPYDMSASYGLIGELDHPTIIEAKQKVLATALKRGIAAGIHVVKPSIEEVNARIKEGYNFIAYSTDAIVLNDNFQEACDKIRGSLNK